MNKKMKDNENVEKDKEYEAYVKEKTLNLQ